LTRHELATVLAALRYWQHDLKQADEIDDSGEHLSEHLPLDPPEIDELCEQLNFAAYP
jgi:hypothetical protein